MEREEFSLRALLELKKYDDVIREASGGDKGPGRLNDIEMVIRRLIGCFLLFIHVYFFDNE